MTPEQRAVLAHVVVDPDAWYAHAVQTFGQEKADEFLTQKVARHSPAYQAEVLKGNYQDRAQRQAVENAAQEARLQAQLQARALKIAAEESALQARIDAAVRAALAK